MPPGTWHTPTGHRTLIVDFLEIQLKYSWVVAEMMVAYVRAGEGTGPGVRCAGAGNNWARGGPEQTLHSRGSQIELSHVGAVARIIRQREPRFLPAPARPHCILLRKKYSLCLYPWHDECESGVCEEDALCEIYWW
jgi:hypothetical protein